VLFRVNLSTDLMRVHRIADFGRNVNILYEPFKGRDYRFLLYLLTFERQKNLRLADVTFNKIEFDPTHDYGKKPAKS
jgi:hypothetical protein